MSRLDELAKQATSGNRRALEDLCALLKDDIYRLSMRMLSDRSDAEDATQDILIKVVTHLSQFRGESSFRTWAWAIASRHLISFRKGVRERFVNFGLVEAMIREGDSLAVPDNMDPEKALLADEVRIGCTGAMLLSLDRDHRIAYVLAEIFAFDGNESARILQISPSTFRKRLERARGRLASFLASNCGLADPSNSCRCARQVPVNVSRGTIDPSRLQFANHAVSTSMDRVSTPRERLREANEIERAAQILRAHPGYAAPDSATESVRKLITSGRYRIFDA